MKLAERFHAEQAARFVIFDTTVNSFVETAFDADIGAAVALSPPSLEERTRALLRGRVMDSMIPVQRLQRVLTVVHHLDARIDSSRKALARLRARAGLRSICHRISRARLTRRPDHRGAVSPFRPGDILLVLDAAWDYPSIQQWLGQRKGTSGIAACYLIYDLIPVIAPHTFGPGFAGTYAQYLRQVLTLSDLILTDSQSTARDLTDFAERSKLNAPDLIVIRLGDDVRVPKPVPLQAIEEPFLLAVGTIEVRKNYLLLYQACKLALEEGVDLPPIIIVGRRGWLADDTVYAIQEDPQTRSRMRIISGVADDQLAWLYEHCMMVVYPSQYEGWGLPIAEALNRGKLCLSSRTSAMPEIAGDLIEYFSPFDARECLDLIVKYMHAETRAAKEEEIKRRFESVDWDQTYEQVKRALESLQPGRGASA